MAPTDPTGGRSYTAVARTQLCPYAAQTGDGPGSYPARCSEVACGYVPVGDAWYRRAATPRRQTCQAALLRPIRAVPASLAIAPGRPRLYLRNLRFVRRVRRLRSVSFTVSNTYFVTNSTDQLGFDDYPPSSFHRHRCSDFASSPISAPSTPQTVYVTKAAQLLGISRTTAYEAARDGYPNTASNRRADVMARRHPWRTSVQRAHPSRWSTDRSRPRLSSVTSSRRTRTKSESVVLDRPR